MPMYGMEGTSGAADDGEGGVDIADAAVPAEAGGAGAQLPDEGGTRQGHAELEAYCLGLWDKYKLQDTVPYNPWKEAQDIVVFPGAIGGGNWQGVAFNKPLGLIITNVMNAGQWGHLQEGGGRGGRGGRGAAPIRTRPMKCLAPARGARAGGDPPAQTPANVVPPGRRRRARRI
jgi:hypothetical protein